MSAVWRASRASVRRRRLQTFIIGVVVLFSAATVVAALALLNASTGPFDEAFDQQRGAHLVATFDPGKVSDALLTGTVPKEVEAVAGPFHQAVFEVASDSGQITSRSLTVVGRADPGGPVDRVELWIGRWATGPGEIVLNSVPERGVNPVMALGAKLNSPGRPTLTVVGRAYSVSQSADAWVSPEQIQALRPTATEMLYRFTGAATASEIETGLAAATTGIPSDGLLATQSYLTVKAAIAAGPGVYVPFLIVFGLLGLVVAVLIVANVVSGAVVSGLRHTGVLKAIGFTPRQVVAVYVVMVLIPAVIGCVLGVVLGAAGAEPLVKSAFQGLGFGGRVGGLDVRVMLAVLLGIPAIVMLAAFVPALRAYRLSASEAISAGSASRTGRGLRTQRWLSGTTLPRSVSLGLGLPFARPGRTVLTLAAIVLGVTTATFATGLASTVARYADATDSNNTAPVAIRAGNPAFGEVPTQLTDPQIETLLRSLPGTAGLFASLDVPLSVVGQTKSLTASFLRGDATQGLQRQVVKGRWLHEPGEIVVPSAVLRQRGLTVDDRINLQLGERRTTVTIVGETLSAGVGGAGEFFADWQTLNLLAPDYKVANFSVLYQVQVKPGVDVDSHVRAVRAAAAGLKVWNNTGTNSLTVTVTSLSYTLSVMLGIVAALGVFNTVVLNVRERRRDLGMLKSIGMTPRQVVVMIVTSMASIGVIGGLIGIPIGIVAHHLIVPVAAHAAQIDAAEFLFDVWHAGMLAVLALAGVAIATIGALIPARSAGRLVIAEVLHNE